MLREVVETRSTIRELGRFDNYYIDHKTFNIITIIFKQNQILLLKLQVRTYN